MPFAFNLPYPTLQRLRRQADSLASPGTQPPEAGAPAWAVPWNQLAAAPLLQQLLEAGVRIRTAMQPFSIGGAAGMRARDDLAQFRRRAARPCARGQRGAQLGANEVHVHFADLDVRAGEVLALVGENGAGKTTLIKLLAGLSTPSSGRILLDGLEQIFVRSRHGTALVHGLLRTIVLRAGLLRRLRQGLRALGSAPALLPAEDGHQSRI